MDITIEQLYEKLQAEIAAREILENKLNAQSNGMANIENRLGSQIQSVASSLESRLQSVETATNSEAEAREDADKTLRSTLSLNTSTITEEAAARASADEALQGQIQTLSAASSSLESAIKSCRDDITVNTANIQNEIQSRTDEYDSLVSTVQEAKSEMTQSVSNLQTSLEFLSDKTNELEERASANNETVDGINTSVATNTAAIEKNTQDINAVKDDLTQTKESILSEDAVNDLIANAFSDKFTAQEKELQDMLAQEKEARDADIDNIQDYAARAQNACEQSRTYLENYQQTSQNAAQLMRNTFNLLLPKGTILPYAGSLREIPDGWRLCNGANGTPDLVGKVLVGAPAINEEETEFAFGSEGGEKEVLLDTNNLPAHFHFAGTVNAENRGYFFVSGSDKNGETFDFKNIPRHEKLWGAREWTGSGNSSFIHSAHMMEDDTGINIVTSNQVSDGITKAHNNMQPYRCVYYIMKMF